MKGNHKCIVWQALAFKQKMFHKSTGHGAETFQDKYEISKKKNVFIIAIYLATSIRIHHDKPNLVANQEKRPPEALMVSKFSPLSLHQKSFRRMLDQCVPVFGFL